MFSAILKPILKVLYPLWRAQLRIFFAVCRTMSSQQCHQVHSLPQLCQHKVPFGASWRWFFPNVGQLLDSPHRFHPSKQNFAMSMQCSASTPDLMCMVGERTWPYTKPEEQGGVHVCEGELFLQFQLADALFFFQAGFVKPRKSIFAQSD